MYFIKKLNNLKNNLNFKLLKFGTEGGTSRYKYIIIFIIFLLSISIRSFGEITYDDNGYAKESDGTIISYQPATQVPAEDVTYPDYVGYYKIENAGNLYWFANYVNDEDSNEAEKRRSANAILTKDIEIINEKDNSKEYELLQNLIKNSGECGKDELEKFNWIPIGKYGYTGTFDGRGYTISGIYCEVTPESGTGNAGLFDSVGALAGDGGGTVKDVGVKHSYFWVNGDKEYPNYAGAICGQILIGSVEKCYSLNTRIEITNASGYYIGGICGKMTSGDESLIKNCYSAGLKLKASGEISTVYLGGIVGGQDDGNIENCYSSVKQEDMVGIVGNNDNNTHGIIANFSGNDGTISNCYYYKYGEKYWHMYEYNDDEGESDNGNKLKDDVLKSLNKCVTHESGCDGTKSCNKCMFKNNPKAVAEGYNEFLVFKIDSDLKIPVRVKINYDPSNQLESLVSKNFKHQLFRKTKNMSSWEEMLENIHYAYDVEPVNGSIKINPDGSKTQDFIFNYYIVHLERNIDELYSFGFNKNYPVNTYLKQDVGGGKKLFIDYGVGGRE
ncbi:MAG: hypothetical protein J6C55_02105 [Oscillospiraceae bacterium]|nr:hypothetical protein [Oscillospiraceae bacterium]